MTAPPADHAPTLDQLRQRAAELGQALDTPDPDRIRRHMQDELAANNSHQLQLLAQTRDRLASEQAGIDLLPPADA